MPCDCRAVAGDGYRAQRCFGLVLMEAVLATAAGYAIGRGDTLLAIMLNLLVLLPFTGFCRTAKIDFGFSGLLWSQLLAHAVACCLILTVVGLPFSFSYEFFGTHRLANAIVGLVTAVTSGLCVALLGGPPIYLSGALAVAFRGLYGVALPIDKVPGYMPLYGWTLATWSVITSFARYQKDQSALGLLGIVISNMIPYGYSLAGQPGDSWLSLGIAVILAYIQVLWMRRGRQFPPGLRDCKYVTLDYLRRIAASGEGIRRCQDLPPDAFGHPRKARYVISVSHRWLDRYTCDVRTDEFPEGTRLRTMVAALDRYFSVRGLGKGHGFWNRLQRFSMALTGGRDVVLFFDYMSLPQEWRAPDGTVYPRSSTEQRIFERCLPNMGALYSMLPVLVCEEVPRGTKTYLESGWCFAEASTAWLGNQLERYSSNSNATSWLNRLSQHTEQPLCLAHDLDEELAHKYFLRENDREEVRQIIRGFLTKSLLVHALKHRSSHDLQEVLTSETLKARGGGLLDQAIDSDLNTPLHLAVSLNFPEGVRQLLDAGARKELRNQRGDTPVERWMFPRVSKAALVCRSYRAGNKKATRSPATATDLANTATTAAGAAATPALLPPPSSRPALSPTLSPALSPRPGSPRPASPRPGSPRPGSPRSESPRASSRLSARAASSAAEAIARVASFKGLRKGHLEGSGASKMLEGKSEDYAAIFKFFREQPTDHTERTDRTECTEGTEEDEGDEELGLGPGPGPGLRATGAAAAGGGGGEGGALENSKDSDLTCTDLRSDRTDFVPGSKDELSTRDIEADTVWPDAGERLDCPAPLAGQPDPYRWHQQREGHQNHEQERHDQHSQQPRASLNSFSLGTISLDIDSDDRARSLHPPRLKASL